MQRGDRGGVGAIHLVDDHDVGHVQHRLTGMVGVELVGSQCVHHHDVQVGLQERKVVVAAVPQDEVGFCLCGREHAFVVDACEDHAAGSNVRLVFFPLLDGAVRGG